MTYEIGVMQGRLLPKYKGQFQAHPKNYWQDEFRLASKLGFAYIEFILDFEDYNQNPLLNITGLNAIKNKIKKENILVKSVCADFYMTSPIYINDKDKEYINLEVFKKLIKNCSFLGVKDIVLPLVDNSSILNSIQKRKNVILFLNKIKEFLERFNVNVCLETDLPPKKFLKLISDLDYPFFKINYDTGNSAYMGYDFKEELETYAQYVTNIHIKDRIYKGESVILGNGACQFDKFFQHLKKINYTGITILQAYRNNDGISSIKPQLKFIKEIINTHFRN